MPFKMIMSWDIVPEHEQEYFEFVVRDFIPGVQRLGFELTDAWATVYGRQPQIQVGAISNSLVKIRNILRTPEWVKLHGQLQDFVTNYTEKIVESRGGFQF